MPEQLSVTPGMAKTTKKKPPAQPQAAPAAPADTTQGDGPDWTKMLEMGVPAAMLVAGLISGSRAKGKKRAAVGESMQGFGQALMQLTAMKEQGRQATAAGLERTKTAETGARAAEEKAKAKADADAGKAKIDADKEARRKWEWDVNTLIKLKKEDPENETLSQALTELLMMPQGSLAREPEKPDYGPKASLYMDEQTGKVDPGTFEGIYGKADKAAPSTQWDRNMRIAYDVPEGMTLQEAAKENSELDKAIKRKVAIDSVMPLLMMGDRLGGGGFFGGDPGAAEQFGLDLMAREWAKAMEVDEKPPEAYAPIATELSSMIGELIQEGKSRSYVERYLKENGYNPLSSEWRTHIEPVLNDYERQLREAAKKKR